MWVGTHPRGPETGAHVHSHPWTRALAGIALSLLAARAGAQTLTLPMGGLYPAGPDYATDVLQDAWDFSNFEDIAPDPDQMLNWTVPNPTTVRSAGTGPAFLSGGWFRGVPAADSNVTLLYRADAQALNPGRSGARYPIETSRYQKLAVKMRITGAPHPAVAVAYWFHASLLEPNWQNRAGAGALAPNVPAGTSEQVYTLDLAQANPVYAPGAPYTAEALVKALRFDPLDPVAQGVEIDWVRLTASNAHSSAAIMPVSLAGCSGLQSLTITDGAGISVVVTDLLGSGSSNRSFNYGILPPGAYTIRASCGNGSTAPVGFTINTPPVVTVVDPDEIGDPATDYAALARNGDPWDFEQATDVVRSFNVTASGGACPSTGPCGIVPAEAPGSGSMLRLSSDQNVGDPGLELLDGRFAPLNTRRHSILSFVFRNRRPYVLNAVIGPVLRVMWGSGPLADAFTVTTSQDMRAWPGLQRYTIDLSTLRTNNGGIETECLPYCPTTPWPERAVRHFRLDPHEYTDQPTTFDIDDLTLTAPDEVSIGQQFVVRYGFTDPDGGGAYTARIYRENWDTRTGRTLVATLPSVAPGAALSYALSPQASGMGPGRYLISVEIDETRGGFTDTSRAEATGPLVVFDHSASSPSLTVDAPTAGQVPQFFTVQGCAYDTGATSGIGMDEIAVDAIAGANVVGQPPGKIIALGLGSPRGTLQFGPLGTPVVCPGVGNPASPFRNSGFRIVDAGLERGSWTIRVYARSTVSGQFVQFPDIPVTIGDLPASPVNFQASAAGNTLTVSWQAPAGGASIAGYILEVATNPSFSPVAMSVGLGAPGTYSGQLASGTYYLRVFTRDSAGRLSAPSPVRIVDVALPQAPGAPVLVAAQVSANPVTLAWSAGSGGAPTAYTVHAGTAPGASNLAVAPMGLATSVTAVAPVGAPIYVRVVATNAVGSATSNEIVFTLTPPTPPTLHPATVANGHVTLGWSAVGGASGYVVVARYEGSANVIATLPVSATGLTVPAPPGRYVVSVMARNGLGTSAESNAILVVVP